MSTSYSSASQDKRDAWAPIITQIKAHELSKKGIVNSSAQTERREERISASDTAFHYSIDSRAAKGHTSATAALQNRSRQQRQTPPQDRTSAAIVQTAGLRGKEQRRGRIRRGCLPQWGQPPQREAPSPITVERCTSIEHGIVNHTSR